MNIPQNWTAILQALHYAGHPEAFIGGGALRDLDNGAPIKDVDIFIQAKPGVVLFENLSTVLHGLTASDVTQVSQYEHSDIAEVFEFTGDTYPLNVIVIKPTVPADGFMLQQLDRFDIGLCRVAYDGRRIEYTSPYCVDKAEKRITIVNPWNLERSIERANRIAAKYPGWPVVYAGLNDIIV